MIVSSLDKSLFWIQYFNQILYYSMHFLKIFILIRKIYFKNNMKALKRQTYQWATYRQIFLMYLVKYFRLSLQSCICLKKQEEEAILNALISERQLKILTFWHNSSRVIFWSSVTVFTQSKTISHICFVFVAFFSSTLFCSNSIGIVGNARNSLDLITSDI